MTSRGPVASRANVCVQTYIEHRPVLDFQQNICSAIAPIAAIDRRRYELILCYHDVAVTGRSRAFARTVQAELPPQELLGTQRACLRTAL